MAYSEEVNMYRGQGWGGGGASNFISGTFLHFLKPKVECEWTLK